MSESKLVPKSSLLFLLYLRWLWLWAPRILLSLVVLNRLSIDVLDLYALIQILLSYGSFNNNPVRGGGKLPATLAKAW
jgi:hypothetical protein